MERVFFQKILITVCAILLIFAALSSVFAVGIYEFGWSGFWMAYVPLPAALVNGRFITQSDVFRRLAAYKNLTGGSTDPKKTILANLTEEEIISDLVKKLEITVSDSEADQ